MSHMAADTRDELLEMVDRIGVPRRWLQHEGQPDEHFDIAKSKRELAVAAGAVEVTMREMATWMFSGRRGAPGGVARSDVDGHLTWPDDDAVNGADSER